MCDGREHRTFHGDRVNPSQDRSGMFGSNYVSQTVCLKILASDNCLRESSSPVLRCLCLSGGREVKEKMTL